MNDLFFKPGDYVVGSYDALGKQLKPGKVYGDEDEVNKLQEAMLTHGERHGGKNLDGKQKKNISKKKKTVKPKQETSFFEVEPEPESFYQPPQEDIKPNKKKKYIYLFNKLGKIKLAVEEVLECDQAYCLIFQNEDDLIFTPNPGETLNMINLEGNQVQVYYPNALFTWTDREKQLLILFKKDDDE